MDPILKHIEELEEYRNLGIKSKTKFQGDFYKVLDELVGEIEKGISKKIIPNYGVVYTTYGKEIIKIKIKDEDLMTEKLISCNLFYSKNDERYGHVTPIFSSTEKSQKTKKYELSKFPLSNLEDIVNAITDKLQDIIEEF